MLNIDDLHRVKNRKEHEEKFYKCLSKYISRQGWLTPGEISCLTDCLVPLCVRKELPSDYKDITDCFYKCTYQHTRLFAPHHISKLIYGINCSRKLNIRGYHPSGWVHID